MFDGKIRSNKCDSEHFLAGIGWRIRYEYRWWNYKWILYRMYTDLILIRYTSNASEITWATWVYMKRCSPYKQTLQLLICRVCFYGNRKFMESHVVRKVMRPLHKLTWNAISSTIHTNHFWVKILRKKKQKILFYIMCENVSHMSCISAVASSIKNSCRMHYCV